MPMAKKVLVIEDSALMRKHLRRILEEGGFEVEVARNGQEGLDKLPEYDPDVVTLDINMPVMDGITCLSLIMNKYPKPVVMVSSLTEKGALVTFEALELGAVDYVPKPGGTVSLNMDQSAEILLSKVGAAAKMKIRSSTPLQSKLRVRRERAEASTDRKSVTMFSRRQNCQFHAIVMGVSTGGPGTLQEILTTLPQDFPIPIIVAQHMPARFTQVFAERLNKMCNINVTEVSSPTELLPGSVYIGRGDADIKVVSRSGKRLAISAPADESHLWHPSVEHLVNSAVQIYGASKVLCVQLTGMGHDGAQAMADAKKNGALTIAESEETAVVFGMPRELIELNAADKILPKYKIADALINAVK